MSLSLRCLNVAGVVPGREPKADASSTSAGPCGGGGVELDNPGGELP